MTGLIILGTRPEALKLIPIIKKALDNRFSIVIVSTDQHEEAITHIFEKHNLKLDYRLKRTQVSSLGEQIASYLAQLSTLFHKKSFDFVITQGDTLSAYAGMLFAFFKQIDFLYVESGLRTLDLDNPFPEEGLRVMMSHIAKMNFVPTQSEKDNLEKENIASNKIMIVGNTSIDYLMGHMPKKQKVKNGQTILLTVHRRENWHFLEAFFTRLVNFAQNNPHIIIEYPMHFNPTIQKLAKEVLSESSNIHLYEPLEIQDFYQHLLNADLIVTDSGGVQEEATFLNKKVIVIRDKTERIFTDENIQIMSITESSLFDEASAMLHKSFITDSFNTIYGDGHASTRIIDWIKKEYER